MTSDQVAMTEMPREEDGDGEGLPVERDPLFVPPVTSRFHLQLFSPASWEIVPNTK